MPAPPGRPRSRTSAAAEPAALPACPAPLSARPSRPRPQTERAGRPPWAGPSRCPARRSRRP
eukprot:169435-Alexandrium_andersonii.AAC.1